MDNMLYYRPGKNRQDGKLIAGKFCDLEGKNKEIRKYIGEYKLHISCWREILSGLQGNKHFFHACSCSLLVYVFNFDILTSYKLFL